MDINAHFEKVCKSLGMARVNGSLPGIVIQCDILKKCDKSATFALNHESYQIAQSNLL